MITTQESMTEMEAAWRSQIDGISLLAELEVDRDEIQQALKFIGVEWISYSRGEAARRLRARFPAVLVTALTGGASLHYDAGELWPPLFKAANIWFEPNDAQAIGRVFEDCLDRLGLPTFPELDQHRAQRYVSRILLHAGIPIYCMRDWLDVIRTEADRLGTDDAAVIHEQLAVRAAANRLPHVDVPVRRFIQFGGDYAVDFLDRSLELVRALRAGIGVPSGLGLGGFQVLARGMGSVQVVG